MLNTSRQTPYGAGPGCNCQPDLVYPWTPSYGSPGRYSPGPRAIQNVGGSAHAQRFVGRPGAPYGQVDDVMMTLVPDLPADAPAPPEVTYPSPRREFSDTVLSDIVYGAVFGLLVPGLSVKSGAIAGALFGIKRAVFPISGGPNIPAQFRRGAQ